MFLCDDVVGGTTIFASNKEVFELVDIEPRIHILHERCKEHFGISLALLQSKSGVFLLIKFETNLKMHISRVIYKIYYGGCDTQLGSMRKRITFEAVKH